MKNFVCIMLSLLILTAVVGCTPTEVSQNSSSEETVNEPSQAEKVTELRLEDYGGAADGETDNMIAARKLSAALRFTVGKKRIIFSEGTYRFVPNSYSHVFNLNSIADLELVGQGTEKTSIIIANPYGGFLFVQNGKNVSTKGFSIDFEILPFTQGTIVSVDKEACTYDLKIDEGFGVPTEAWFTEQPSEGMDVFRTTHLLDPETKNFKVGVVNSIAVDKEVVYIGDRTYRFKSATKGMFAALGRGAWAAGQIEAGDLAVIIMRHAPHLMYYHSCENTLFEDLNVYAAGGFALINIDTRGTAVARNINIRRKGNRLVTLNADAINFTACRAKPIVEDSYIEANCDDSISGGSHAPVIKNVVSSKELFVQEVHFASLKTGDRVAVFNQRDGHIVGESKIANVKPYDFPEYGSGYMVTLETPIEGISADNDKMAADLLFTPDIMSSGFTIRNTTVAVKAGRAVFLHAQDVLIENSRFIEVANESLLIANEATSLANGYVNNVVIRNNEFRNTTYGFKNWDIWSTISVGTMRQFNPAQGDIYLYNAAKGRITRNVEIYNNTFINSSANHIYLSAVEDALIRDNTFKSDEGIPIIKNDAIIALDNSSNVVVSGNIITDKRSGLQSIISLYGNTPKDEGGVILENNTIDSSTDRIIR